MGILRPRSRSEIDFFGGKSRKSRKDITPPLVSYCRDILRILTQNIKENCILGLYFVKIFEKIKILDYFDESPFPHMKILSRPFAAPLRESQKSGFLEPRFWEQKCKFLQLPQGPRNCSSNTFRVEVRFLYCLVFRGWFGVSISRALKNQFWEVLDVLRPRSIYYPQVQISVGTRDLEYFTGLKNSIL